LDEILDTLAVSRGLRGPVRVEKPGDLLAGFDGGFPIVRIIITIPQFVGGLFFRRILIASSSRKARRVQARGIPAGAGCPSSSTVSRARCHKSKAHVVP
jgi:hypothetical protein